MGRNLARLRNLQPKPMLSQEFPYHALMYAEHSIFISLGGSHDQIISIHLFHAQKTIGDLPQKFAQRNYHCIKWH
ncbi:hypothetical protein RB195_015903 [Necator americanus]|uniref:Uncharacterized protein n=1 Tax=Necator americanus TaxID=51031 RepID=A0ABR1E6P3_NECAM